MKKTLLSILAVILLSSLVYAQIAINTDGSAANASAMLEIKSATKGLLIPRLTQTQRDAVSLPATGLMVYQTDNSPGFYFYNGSVWVTIGAETISINDLSDGRIVSNSLFLGATAGTNDDGTTNENVGIGIGALKTTSSGNYNTATGYEALNLNTIGAKNTGFGNWSLRSNTEGNNNTSNGFQSLYSNTTGSNNIGIGYNANYYNQTGSNNTIIGVEAGLGNSLHNKTGNIFLGYQAGYTETGNNKLYIENSNSNSPLIYGEFDNNLLRINGTLNINSVYSLPTTDGSTDQILKTDGSGILSWVDETNIGAIDINGLSDGKTGGYSVFLGSGSGTNDDGTNNKNVAVGYFSLSANNSGSQNSAFGYGALSSNTSSLANTAIGNEALFYNTTGISNVAVGSNSLWRNTTKGNLVAIGDSALFNNGQGVINLWEATNNTAVGSKSLYSNTSGFANTATGFEALKMNSFGAKNTACGASSSASNISGSNNTSVGNMSLYTNSIGSNNTALGSMALQTNTASYNTAIGYSSLFYNTTGANNTAGGYLSLENNGTGSGNTAFGSSASNKNTTGDYNSSFGTNALYSMTTAGYNSGFGSYAMYSNTSGTSNVAVGSMALQNNTQGSYNTALGKYALRNNTTANHNIAIGSYALYTQSYSNGNTPYNAGNVAIGDSSLFYCQNTNSVNGKYNTAIGHNSLTSNTWAFNNTAIGYNASYSNTTGVRNTVVGARSLNKSTYGDNNTAVGFETLTNLLHGNRNVAVGTWALDNCDTANSNTAIGLLALKNLTKGDYNTAIGVYVYPSMTTTYSNYIGIGYNVGNLLSNSSNRVEIGNTSMTWIGGQVGWSTYSDQRIKENIINDVPGLDFIRKLNPVSYNLNIHHQNEMLNKNKTKVTGDWQGKYDIEKKRITGFLAQEVALAAQDLDYEFSGVSIPDNDDALYSLTYSAFVVPLVKAVQELDFLTKQQQQIIDLLEQKNESLQDKLNSFEQRLKQIETEK